MSQEAIRKRLEDVLEELGVEVPSIHLERPRDPDHGDWATNVAMTLASTLRRPPRAIAEDLAHRFGTGHAGVASVEVAGPGFLNFRLGAAAVAGSLARILDADEEWGKTQTDLSDAPDSAEGGRPIMVEFVSANPTGLLHLGHGRQAALGDAISTLLEWTGWTVHREFYYNDAGRQIERLAESVRARYLQALGQDAEMPEGGYMGDTVKAIARDLLDADKKRWASAPEADALAHMKEVAVRRLRREQDLDLHAFGVEFDEYFLESSLYDDGLVDDTVSRLRDTGLVYEHEGAVWLKTTEFGDQKDRVMIKSDGSATYFLPDVAYHRTKWERGYREAINVQGADHHGTTARVRAGLQALRLPEGYPEYVLHQMVTVERGGEEVKFSKRDGDYLTLRDLVEEVGRDVTRYFFLMRKPEAHLVFDLDWAADESDKNPVYKAKYAHARVCSILRKPQASVPVDSAGFSLLSDELERDLIQQLDSFPELVETAARLRAPHLVCEWLEQTAGKVNAWYHAGNPARHPERAVLCDDPELRAARLALTTAVRISLRNALHLLGLEAPERMVRAEEPEPDTPSSPPTELTTPGDPA